jgi:hypothetical protein
MKEYGEEFNIGFANVWEILAWYLKHNIEPYYTLEYQRKKGINLFCEIMTHYVVSDNWSIEKDGFNRLDTLLRGKTK